MRREEKTKQISQETDSTDNSANGYPGNRSSSAKEQIKARDPHPEFSRENPGNTLFWINYAPHKLNSFLTPDKTQKQFPHSSANGVPKIKNVNHNSIANQIITRQEHCAEITRRQLKPIKEKAGMISIVTKGRRN